MIMRTGSGQWETIWFLCHFNWYCLAIIIIRLGRLEYKQFNMHAFQRVKRESMAFEMPQFSSVSSILLKRRPLELFVSQVDYAYFKINKISSYK